MWKKAKIVNFQTQITFYLHMRRRKRKYEFVSKFYELFENHHHLSGSLNYLSDFGSEGHSAKIVILATCRSLPKIT